MGMGAGLLWVTLGVRLAVDVAVVPHAQAPLQQAQAEEAVRGILQAEGRKVLAAPDTALGISQAREAGWTCDGQAGCMVPLSRALGVPALVDVQQDGAVLRVRWLQDGTVVAQASSGWPASAAARSRVGRALTGVRGAVVLHATGLKGVRVDGEEVLAAGPVTSVGGLTPGNHLLEVTRHNGARHTLTVTVVDAPVAVDAVDGGLVLQGTSTAPAVGSAGQRVAPPQSRPVWLGAVGLGVGAAVLALAAVLATSVGGVLLVATGARAQGLPRDGRGRLAAEPGQPRAEVERIQQGLLLGLGGGTGLVITGVVLFVLGVVSGGGAAVVLGLWRTLE